MKRTVFILIVVSIISKILGLGRDVTLSYFYGASNITDAYLVSLTIPTVVFGFIGAGISTGYIPMYTKIENRNGVIIANRYTNNVVNLLLVISLFIVVIGILFTDQLLKIFASGFDSTTFDLAIKFTRISLFGIFFTALIYVFKGFLQIKNDFIMPVILGLPLNFIIILSIFISIKTNVIWLSIGSVVAIIAQLLILWPSLNKKGYKYELILDLKDKHLKNMAYIAFPVILGSSVGQINTLVDRSMASHLAIGGISALDYATKINGLVEGIFVVSIATVLFPAISKMAAKNDMDGLKKSVLESVGGVILLVIPATVGTMVLAEPIVKILFGRGAFDLEAVNLTSKALFYYSIGLIGHGLTHVLYRAFYSLQDTKTPMKIAVIGLVTNIVLNISLSRFMGISGLALATSISVILCSILLFISLRKKVGRLNLKKSAITFSKILCASLIMGLFTKISYYELNNYLGETFSLLVSGILAILIYSLIILFINIPEVDLITNSIKNKLKKKTM